MKLAIAYNTMNKLHLTKQTFPILRDGQHALLWSDGSTDPEALAFFEQNSMVATESYAGVRGGADAAIVHAFTRLLQHPAKYTHVGLVESDVLLDEDWQAPTMALFGQGAADGLCVGAVSARSYTDRILIQRDDYAVMLNLGAGMIIMTRAAAQIVLNTFRTGWWPATRYLFAQLSGIDIATYACFAGRDQWTTSDWSYEAQLARMGYAALALTPSKASMVGQMPPLHEQGLTLTQGPVDARRDEEAFEKYVVTLGDICCEETSTDLPGIIHRDGAGHLFFPHQLGYLAGGPTWQGTLELQWSQGFGPFAYRAGPGGASLLVHISGSCSFLVTGGVAGARVAIADTRSGFNFAPELPPGMEQFASLNVPGGPIPRRITLELAEGAVFYGLSTADPQMLDTTFSFDWAQLPEAK